MVEEESESTNTPFLKREKIPKIQTIEVPTNKG
jgi:hypothetical protein